jgi:hypothetical protein
MSLLSKLVIQTSIVLGSQTGAVPAKNTFSDSISTNIVLKQTAAILQKALGNACKETARRRQ